MRRRRPIILTRSAEFTPDSRMTNPSIDPAAIMAVGRRVVGVVEGGIDPRRFIPRLIDHYRAGQLPLEKLVRTYPFAEIERAFAASSDGSVVKPVLVMPVAEGLRG